ncbi:MAG: pentapeptide repeat-containing protein [Bdellovibrionales bacterium]
MRICSFPLWVAVSLAVVSIHAPAEIAFVDGQCRDSETGKPAWHEHLLAPCSDLEKKTLINQDFNKLDLTGSRANQANLSRSRLTSTRFLMMSWPDGHFDQGVCHDSKFSHADMRGLKAKDSQWTDCQLDHVDLRGSRFYQAQMTGGSLSGARLAYSALILSTFRDVDLRGTDFTDALVSMNTWQGCVFDNTTQLPFSEAKALELGMRKVTN